jgi:hypothetical protein
MPRTPAFRHRHQTGSGHERLTPKRVTYAVTVDADDSPDAIAKVKNLASGRHLETIRSPLSHRNRKFLGDASPLNAVRDRCDIRNMAAIERLDGHIDELKQHLRESTLRIDRLSRESVEQKRELVELKRRLTFQEKRHQRQIKNLKRQIKNLKRNQKDLLDSRRKIICRKIVVCV